MQRLDYLLFGAVALLATLVGVSAHELRPRTPGFAHVAPPAGMTVESDGGAVGAATAAPAPRTAPPLDRSEVRRRLQLAEAGTYIGDLLAAHDSSLARWPD